MSLTKELLEDATLGPKIKSLTAIPASGGRFEVTVNDDLVYSKLATGRHADPGEIYSLVAAKLS